MIVHKIGKGEVVVCGRGDTKRNSPSPHQSS
jgi:hypothetical protein